MSTENILIIGLLLITCLALIGIFRTKTQGFGRFSSSLILLTLVLAITAILLVAGKIEGSVFANVVFAIAGFSGGLITGKSDT